MSQRQTLFQLSGQVHGKGWCTVLLVGFPRVPNLSLRLPPHVVEIGDGFGPHVGFVKEISYKGGSSAVWKKTVGCSSSSIPEKV